jgi:NAD(P)-dependent dehydrogenase (short-subunit alcohol dehydrogenase family)
MRTLGPQVVLVTGCSSGIGRALAEALLGRGHTVVATARRRESLEGLHVSSRLVTLALDVTDPASVRAAVTTAIEQLGRIDILVNNAGFNLVGPLAEVPLVDVEVIFRTNVAGPLALIQAVVPHMVARRHGRIVNIGSMVGVVPTPFTGAYCASKSALHMLSDVLRLELWPFGIEVISVEPGRVRSEISKNARVDLDRYESAASLYRAYAEGIRRRLRASQVAPMDTAPFAAHVAAAITRARAPRIVRAGRGAVVLPRLKRLAPARLLDWGLRRAFGLGRVVPRAASEGICRSEVRPGKVSG